MAAPIGLSRRKQLGFAVVSTLLGLSLLEAGARIVEGLTPFVPVDSTLGFDAETRLFVHERTGSATTITNPKKLSSFLDQRFLAKKPDGTFRVVALGESSVNFAEPELMVLSGHLEDALHADDRRAEVINAGGLSYGSHRLVLMIGELLDYEPDVVLVYMGHNEFEEVEQLRLARPSLRLLPVVRAAEHAALFRVARNGMVRFNRARLEEAHRERLLATSKPDFGRAAAHRFTLEDVAQRMAAFRDNLRFILETCRRRGVPVVVGTIPSNLVKPFLVDDDMARYQTASHLFAAGRYDDGLAAARAVLRTTARRHQSSDIENATIRSLAAELAVPLADVERAVTAHEPHGVPGYRLFLDHCHFNGEGNRIWRLTYERALVPILAAHYDSASKKLERLVEEESESLPPPG
jgi:lysophospholipase L1-like esterase